VILENTRHCGVKRGKLLNLSFRPPRQWVLEPKVAHLFHGKITDAVSLHCAEA